MVITISNWLGKMMTNSKFEHVQCPYLQGHGQY